MNTGLNHFVSKTAITRGVVLNVPATALCGETLIPESQGRDAIPGREAASKKLDICQACELIYDTLPKDTAAVKPEAALV